MGGLQWNLRPRRAVISGEGIGELEDHHEGGQAQTNSNRTSKLEAQVMLSMAILDSEASRKHIHNELRIQIWGGT